MLESTGKWRRIQNTEPGRVPGQDPDTQIIDGSAAVIRHELLRRHPWLSEWLAEERVAAFQAGVSEGIRCMLEDPTTPAGGRPAIPQDFVAALQRGPHSDPYVGGTLVHIDDLTVSVRVSGHGTGRPDPDASSAWSGLCDVVREIAADTRYCPHVIAQLPPQIADASWHDPQGRPVRARRAGP